MMRRFWLTLATILLPAAQALGVAVELTLSPFTGDSASVKITLDDAGGTIAGTVQVIANPNIGDLRAVFFSVLDDDLLDGLSITGPLITATKIDEDKVTYVGKASVKGGGSPGPFDIGIAFGTPGIGSDDIQIAAFLVEHNALDLTLDMFDFDSFAARLTSVGLAGGPREGSSKLSVTEIEILTGPPGNPPTTPTVTHRAANPEPATALLLGVGAVFIGLRRRRGREQN